MSPMTFPQQIAVIALCVLATVSTRFLPFLIFSGLSFCVGRTSICRNIGYNSFCFSYIVFLIFCCICYFDVLSTRKFNFSCNK